MKTLNTVTMYNIRDHLLPFERSSWLFIMVGPRCTVLGHNLNNTALWVITASPAHPPLRVTKMYLMLVQCIQRWPSSNPIIILIIIIIILIILIIITITIIIIMIIIIIFL